MDQHLDEASYMQLVVSGCWWIRSDRVCPGFESQTSMILKGQLALQASTSQMVKSNQM